MTQMIPFSSSSWFFFSFELFPSWLKCDIVWLNVIALFKKCDIYAITFSPGILVDIESFKLQKCVMCNVQTYCRIPNIQSSCVCLNMDWTLWITLPHTHMYANGKRKQTMAKSQSAVTIRTKNCIKAVLLLLNSAARTSSCVCPLLWCKD